VLLPKNSLAHPVDFKKVKEVAQALAPHEKNIDNYAWWVHNYAKKYNLDPFLLLAIIKVESDFNQKAISNTGDYSLAQINYKVWKKELERQGIKLNYYKLKTNYAYALQTMGYILKTLKEKHAKKDPKWFARYHSNTNKYKLAYYQRVNKQMAKIKTIQAVQKQKLIKQQRMNFIAGQ
jgi:soluble lytic murein transglycosylase-like protein